MIKDSLLTSTAAYTIDWPTLSDVNFQTNSDNLLEHKAHTGDTATEGYVTSTEYDGIGRPTKITYPKDVNDFRRELKPQYNKSGALCKVDFDGTEYVKEIAYDAKGQRLLLALGNGTMTRYAYSQHNFRLLRMCSETYGYSYSASTKEHTYAYDSVEDKRKQDLAYLYDLGGNIKSITTDLNDSGYTENYGGTTVANDNELTRKYKYDAINRLIEAIGREAKTHGAGNVWNQPTKTTSPVNTSGMRQYKRTYDYDKMGNIQELQHTSGSNAFTRNFNYRTGLNQLSTIDNGATPTPTVYTTYMHDANGNQTKLNSERFLEWDAADQLKFFKIDDGSTISKWSQYRYSGGQRVKKVYNVAGGNYTTTVYIDGIFEYQYLKRGGSTHERNYCHIMDDSKRIAQIRYGSAQEDITDSTFFIVDDHLGTSTLRLNTSGSLIDRQEYYPFGESSLRTFEYKRYQYTGKERDEESGLYYYGARYYSAWTCRFLGVDPMVGQTFYQGSYVYADNNPIMMNDPTGMVSEGGGDENNSSQDDTDQGDTAQDDLPDFGNENFNQEVSAVFEMSKTGNYAILIHSINDPETGNFKEGTISVKNLDTGEITSRTYKADIGWFNESDEQITDSDGAPINDFQLRVAGQSLVAVWDNEMRTRYNLKVESTAKQNLITFDRASSTPEQVTIMEKAVQDRNNLKTEVRKSISPGAKKVTKVFEQDAKYTPENLQKMYGPDGEKGTNLEGKALNRKIVESSGSTNKLLKGFTKWSRRAGWVGLALGVALSTIDLIKDPSLGNFGEETGGLTGGMIGSMIGTWFAVSAMIALGVATGGLGLLAVAVVGGMIGGFVGSYFGEQFGRSTGDWISK